MLREIIAGIVVLGFVCLLFEMVGELRAISWRLSAICAYLERIAPRESNPFEHVETTAERYLKMQKQSQEEAERAFADTVKEDAEGAGPGT